MLQEHSAILSTFVKLPPVTKIFAFCIFEWHFYTDLLYFGERERERERERDREGGGYCICIPRELE